MNTKTLAKQAPSLVLSGVVCGLASVFYLYEFILQVSPGVMTNELMHAFSVGAAGLGTLSAFYYYSYTVMQLPAGMLYDRFGPRTLLTIAILICALGALLFGSTHNLLIASYGRFLMGIGSAFSFIGALVLISRWFPAKYFAVLAGLVQLMSSLGAIFGEAPLAAAISKFGWERSIIFLAIFGFILAIAVWFVVMDFPPWSDKSNQHNSKGRTLKGIKEVIKNTQTWLIGIYAFAVWAPIVIFAVLWGVPYIAAYYHISTALASSVISMTWIGIGFGSPLIGWISDFIGRRCTPLIVTAVIGILSSCFILYLPDIPFSLMYFLLFFLGVAASGQSLTFGLLRDINHPRVVGTAVGFNNMAVVAGGALFQPLVGFFIHRNWTGIMHHGVPFYTLSSYRDSLWLLPVCYILAFVIGAFLLKETHCRPAYKE